MPLINALGQEIADENLPALALAAGDNPQAFAAQMKDVARVVLEFPKFREGRGFTQARYLRERLGFKGDIRATGQFIPDQFRFLIDCGFTSFVVPDGHTAAQFAAVRGPRQSGQLLRKTLERAREG
jgi:uncharacterized protein (DUF934 family)